MNNRCPLLDGRSIEEYIESAAQEAEEEDELESSSDAESTDTKLNAGDSPVFITVLYFLDGFNKAYFNDMYTFLMQDDPDLGKGTFGQLARFGPERTAVMHLRILEVEQNFKEMPEFNRYNTAYSGIGEGEINKEYFDKATRTFFERFRYIFEKHIASEWLESKTLHYMLMGDKHHAHWLARWLVEYKQLKRDDDATIGVEDEDESMQIETCMFPSKDIELGSHHTRTKGKPVKVNLQDSMLYLTSEVCCISHLRLIERRCLKFHLSETIGSTSRCLLRWKSQ